LIGDDDISERSMVALVEEERATTAPMLVSQEREHVEQGYPELVGNLPKLLLWIIVQIRRFYLVAYRKRDDEELESVFLREITQMLEQRPHMLPGMWTP
jgi:hypothetical protein